MWNSTSISSDLAKGKKFIEKLLHVQHVDKEKDTASEISEPTLQHLLTDRIVCHDSNSTENLENPEANLDILKSSLKDRITGVGVYSNPLSNALGSSKRVTFHAFIVFTTRNTTNSREKTMYWSLEKNGKYIVLQQSTNPYDVYSQIYDTEKGQSVKRHGRVKKKKFAMGNFRPLEDLLRVIWENNQISDPYHLLYSNCQNFASFIFEKLNGQSEKWWTLVSATVDRFRGRKKKAAIELNAIMYQSIVKDDKFDYCKAMMEGRREDFEQMTNDLTSDSLNSVDSQGYTLLEWATVFSTSHWPIDGELKKIGAQIPSDEEGSFRRNVFFIALQYWPPDKKSKLFDSFDVSNGVNKTGDTSLHLALYGEKWKTADEILRKFENYDVNLTNSLGDTLLHLAVKLKNCEIGLFKKILHRTDSENVNKADGNGWTALHYAIDQKSETKVEELLKNKDVDVNIKNHEDNRTALHLVSKWPTIPADLFEIIFKKSTDINAQDVNGNTTLHYALMTKFETAIKEFLKQMNVNVANNQNVLALHCACFYEHIAMDLFQIILEKTNDINAQDEYGQTALHYAIWKLKSKTKVEELLAHKDVNVNVKNNRNVTALHCACRWWKNIPVDLFNLILEKSTDINAQVKDHGWTALHFALHRKSKTKVEKLLAHRDVDVNIKNNSNETALHFASCWRDIPADLFKIILKRSTDINAQNNNGNTALHYAFNRQSPNAITALLKDDRVDINVKNNQNRTALYYSLKWNTILINWFLKFNIKSTDINAMDQDGETVLRLNILGKIIKIDDKKLRRMANPFEPYILISSLACSLFGIFIILKKL